MSDKKWFNRVRRKFRDNTHKYFIQTKGGCFPRNEWFVNFRDLCTKHEVKEQVETKWVFKKVEDTTWGGWWYQYSCPRCGWTTKSNAANLTSCPNCGVAVTGCDTDA